VEATFERSMESPEQQARATRLFNAMMRLLEQTEADR
jgi:hypothetical protein